MSPSSFSLRRLRWCLVVMTVCLLSLCAASLLAQKIAKPLLFTGNTTVVAPPTADTAYAFGPQDFGLFDRGTDCALEALIATNVGNTLSVKFLSATPGYQDTLHKLAGLTTKGDLWPDGCGNPGCANNPAFFGADAGPASNETEVIAAINPSDPNVVNIYNVTISPPKFTQVQSWNIGPNVYPIAAVDLNGDGLADLVVGFGGSNSPKLNGGYAVLINKGNGTFDAPTVVSLTGEGIIALAMVDVNHDEKPDLIALEQSPSTGHTQVGIFLGNGHGVFTAKKTYALTGFTYTILVADLNDDAHPDVILSDGELLLGNGDGTFKTGKKLPLPSSLASFVAADFNHDKKIDLAVVTFSDEVAVFLGNGNGTLQAPTWVLGRLSKWNHHHGRPGWGRQSRSHPSEPRPKRNTLTYTPNAIGGTGGLGVLMGVGDGTFKGALAYPTGSTQSNLAYAIADFNGDGKPDIITASSLLVGDGTGHFTVKLGNQFPSLTNPVGSVIRAADLNNDKVTDAVVTTTDTSGNPSNAYVFLGKSTGGFGTGVALAVSNVLDVAIADFNGDNIPDLAVLSYTVGSGISAHVLLGKGKGSFGAPIAISLPSSVAQSTGGRIFIADFNNDKNNDLLVLDVGSPFEASISGGTYLFLE